MTLNPFDTDGFPPRWLCGGGWTAEPLWGWLHIVSDVVLAGVYLAVPVAVLLFLRRRPDASYRPIYMLFGTVFLLCGIVHGIDALIFYTPLYRLSAYAKVVTAMVSLVTLVSLLRVLPRLLSMQTPERVAEIVSTETHFSQSIANEAIAERQYLELALAGGSIGTWRWNTLSDEVYIDEGVHRLMGSDGKQQITTGKAFFEFVHAEDRQRIQDAARRTLATGDLLDDEFRLKLDNGDVRWIVTKARPLDGSRTTLVGVNYDITAKKRHESELAEARHKAEAANQAKGEFLANMSHEIRTPLTAVIGLTDLLYPKLDSDDKRQMLQMVRQQGRLLLNILNDILDLSKIEAGKLEIHPEPCSVRSIVGDINSLMSPQAGTKGLSLASEVRDDVPEGLLLDPLRIRQVLLNLVGNAIKFTDGGSVSVNVAARRSSDDVGAHDAEGELLIAVDDTGPGIQDDRLEEIFRAFSQADGSITRRFGGTGLGLTICQRLVKMMGGRLHVESELDRGSTFTMVLPLRPVDLPADERSSGSLISASHPVAAESAHFPLRVLLAEDTKTLRFMIERMLAGRVDEVVSVANGDEVLTAVAETERDPDARPFDLVLMDMQMPVLDGFDATSRLRENGFDGRIVAISAGATTAEHLRARQAGCDEQLNKPIDLSELIKSLQVTAQRVAEKTAAARATAGE